jgi:hypothetical protein
MKTLISLTILLACAYTAWPYYHVWRLDQAIVLGDRQAMSQLVDLDSVREQIKRRLNKEVNSSVGDVSNAFVDWLQDGIRRMGDQAVDNLVTLEWVREQLLSKNRPGDTPGFIDRIDYAFFDRPDGFLIRIGELDEDPVHLRLNLRDFAWRVGAVYN